jgi:putative spermidine/putrescine transport system permease protein
MAFRKSFRGATFLFYVAIASLIMPSILISLGIGLVFQRAGLGYRLVQLGVRRASHLDAAVRRADHVRRLQPLFDRRYEEAARDLGATSWQTFRFVVLPIMLPSLIGVGLFGFTLSYDEFART